MYDEDELMSMTGPQRRELARRLAELDGAPLGVSARIKRERRLFVSVVLAAALFLIPWTILLAVSLPRNYQTGHWNAAWVGFDIVLFVFLASSAWAAWRRRQILVLTTIVTATLLITDAWFDIFTADRRDLWVSLVTGLLGNVAVGNSVHRGRPPVDTAERANVRHLAGSDTTDLPLRKLPLFGVDEAVL
jgi:hypothetical protein